MSNKVKIGITYTEARYENYPKWIKGNDDSIEIVELHWDKHRLEEVWDVIEDCDGIVLTGGIDVHPKFYDNPRMDYPNSDNDFNEERDEFEMHVFETAMNFNHPVLGVCRGHQLINVALGGQLIQDLEEGGNNDHRRHDHKDGEHGVSVVENTLLAEITKSTDGEINSAHHQGISIVADDLIASAYSSDSVIEAAEWKDKSDKPWLLLVQWHPERMPVDSPFSKNIRERFLEEIKKNINASSQSGH